MRTAISVALAIGSVGGLAACDTPPPPAPTTTTTTKPPTTTRTTWPTTTTTTTTTTVPSSGQFDIVLRTSGLSGSTLSAFTAAEATWQRAVVGDLADRNVEIPAGGCADGTAALDGTVDDIVIDARADVIDGVGGVLGYAGPCYIRSGSMLPIYGVMIFDSADLSTMLASGVLAEVVEHEMGHVLGIGTIWDSLGLLSGDSGPDPRFLGSDAVSEWHSLGGTGSVPVEADGGEGTAYGHWDESTFRNELMTGYISSSNPLSRMTIASLGDLGYVVDTSAADPYVLSHGFAMRSVPDHHEELHLETVTPSHTV